MRPSLQALTPRRPPTQQELENYINVTGQDPRSVPPEVVYHTLYGSADPPPAAQEAGPLLDVDANLSWKPPALPAGYRRR